MKRDIYKFQGVRAHPYSHGGHPQMGPCINHQNRGLWKFLGLGPWAEKLLSHWVPEIFKVPHLCMAPFVDGPPWLMGGPWPPEIYRWPFSLMDGPSVRNIKCLAFGINGVASPLVNGPHRTYGWPPPNLWMAPPPKILRILAQKQTNFTLLHWLIFQN